MWPSTYTTLKNIHGFGILIIIEYCLYVWLNLKTIKFYRINLTTSNENQAILLVKHPHSSVEKIMLHNQKDIRIHSVHR